MVAVANASTPAVDPATVVEVVVAWGESVLHVAHLASANAAFSLGDRGNFALPAERLGTSRLDLVQGRAVLVPAHVSGLVAVGDQHMTLADARATGHIVDGRLALAHGVRLRFEVGGFTVQVAMVTAAEKLSGRGPRRRLAPWALALLLHAGTLGALASSPRDSLDAEDTAALDTPTRALLVAKDQELGGASPPSPEQGAQALIAPSPEPIPDVRALVESHRFGALGARGQALEGSSTLDFGRLELGHDPLLPSLAGAGGAPCAARARGLQAARSAWMADSSESALKGLLTHALAPRVRARSTSWGCGSEVRITTGSALPWLRRLSRKSSPFMLGMLMSQMINDGAGSPPIFASASTPSTASTMW